MEEARRLIEELRTLVRKTDKESVSRIEEIVEWFKSNQSEENKSLMSEFFDDAINWFDSEIEDVMDMIKRQKR